MKRSINAAVVAVGFAALLLAVSVQAPGGSRQDPFPSFNFMVEIEGVTVASFKEVTGLSCSTEMIEYREGTDPGTIRLLPGLTRCGPLVLKKGLTSNMELWNWYRQTATGNVVRKNGSIVILDQAHTEAARYNFYEAWPAKYQLSELDASDNGILLEEVVIALEWIERA